MNESYSTDDSADQQPDDLFWERIAEKVDLLAAAWETCTNDNDGLPQLAPLVADLPAADRPAILYELIKADLEHRWQDRRAPEYLEYYLNELPELGGAENLPVDVIYEEIQIRLQVGDPVGFPSVAERFPTQAPKLAVLMGTIAVPGNRPADIDDPSRSEMQSTQTFQGEQSSASIDPERLDQIQEGDCIDDFDLLMLLGRGSFAVVFLARQRSLERLVALKISKSVGSEPRTLAQLDHPNIVRVFDQRSSGDSIRMLYMELVAGGTLKDIVDEMRQLERAQLNGKIVLKVVDERLSSAGTAPPVGSAIRHALERASWPTAICEIGSRLADGLAYAHDKGVFHRDIKPANILLTPEASPKLADFNISFQGGHEDEDPNDTFGGSMAYMSPEQLEACHPLLGGSPYRVREPSDVYSLGIVLWELTTGSRPFKDISTKTVRWAASLQRMLDQRRDVELKSLADTLPSDCPPSLRAVLKRCLEPNKKKRFRSAQQLADALRLCLNPRCWKLMQPPDRWYAKIPIRFPIMTVLMATLLPSVFAAIFNFAYNNERIINQMANAKEVFMRVQAVINGIAFPVGIGITVFAAYRCARELRQPPNEQPNAGGTRAMFLGSFMARLALCLWVISGLAYPISIQIGMDGGVSSGVYVHFAMSLALCGMLAGTYPFFLVTLISIRWFLPAMIRREIIRGPKLDDVSRVRRLNRFFLTLTASVPLLGILLILLSAQSVGEEAMKDRQLLIAASIVGLAGFGLMFWLHRVIDEDLLAIQEMGRDR